MAKKWVSLKGKMSPAARARVDARVRTALTSMPLAELRKAVGLTQAQLAETLDLGQGSVSKIENAADMYLSTLRRFIEALGGTLVVKASFPGGREFEIEQLSALIETQGQSHTTGPAKQKRSA